MHPPAYTNMPLNRNAVLRCDCNWLRRQLHDARAQVLPLWRDHNLFLRDETAATNPRYLARPQAAQVVSQAAVAVYLGHRGDAPFFAADLSALSQADAVALVEAQGVAVEFLDLRTAGATIIAPDTAILAYARGILYWHRQNQYCGRCGGATESRRGGHMRQCAVASCAREIFPRINPAVIMLVEQAAPDDGIGKCLLGRRAGMPRRIYSVLAGYVDPGESMEEAVAREVQEEVGLSVCNIAYLTSQPWPFPSALMAAYRAASVDREIVLGDDELEDAGWFSAEQIRGFGEHTEAGCRFALPRRDSIARVMIEGWVGEQGV